MARVGFVGAGQLGRPMVERLVAAGHDVAVFVRRPEVRDALAEAGALTTESVADAAADAEVLLACLFSDDQLREVLPEGLTALPAGAVFASHVTGSARTLESLSAKAPHIRVVDAPVSGTADDVRAGRLTVLLGGERDAVDETSAVVSAYADPVLPTGHLGSALAVKLVNNLLFAANIQLVAAAVDLGRQLGIGEQALLASLGRCSAGSRAMSAMGGFPSLEVAGTRIAPFLSKDVAACASAAAEQGFTPRLLLDVAERGPLPLVPAEAEST